MKGNLLLKISSSLVVAALLAGSPALSFAREPKDKSSHEVTGNFVVIGTGNTGPLMAPAAGKSSIVLINYFGAGGELTVDFNGVTYRVPASLDGGNGVYNHVQFDLAPGTYNYTTRVLGNDTIEVAAGKVTSLGFYANPAEAFASDSSRHENSDETPGGVPKSASDKLADLRQDLDDMFVGVSDITGQIH